jgi:hypothetical protein
LLGKKHEFELSKEGSYLESKTALRSQKLDLISFDIVMNLLEENDGKVHKGAGRGRENKVGKGKCTDDTICGYLAVNYYGHSYGESTFDPVFAISAIMERAGLVENTRGYLIRKKSYQ